MKTGHDGDCWIYAADVKICTCGYLHQIIRRPDSEEYRKNLEAIGRHERALHLLNLPNQKDKDGE